MKESRLIELLNEYDSGFEHRAYNGKIQRRIEQSKNKRFPVWWNSKSFGFIKRLVDHNKINFDKVMKLGILCFVRYDKGEIISVHDVDFDRLLIMLLSISDTPIEDLISYLK